ncbi:MAG: GNAT family N-acetyltransferase [Candidatus Tectomicrobia bacterium]|nr:GNAT family N-acetyltransferase [Candidatus Tectomicrobia bacterium]
MSDATIRKLTWRDIDSIIAIDQKVTGKARESYWKNKIIIYSGLDPGACLVAEADGKVIGFLLGERKDWEFGAPQSGWIEILGIDPGYQGKGIGHLLAAAIIEHFKKSQITKVQTMVERDAENLLAYFRSLGFAEGSLINFSKDI